MRGRRSSTCWAGAIGEVREVHVWTNRPLGYWPQGIPRPEPRTPPPSGFRWNGPGLEARLANAMAGNYPKPEGLAWDLFLGPAPYVDYHPVYHPFNWRGWVDWGCGAIGDMGAHLMDHSMWALDLGYPTTIETVATPFNGVSLPERDDDDVRVPRARRQAAREAHVVRRRPAAAEAGRARRGPDPEPDGRRAAGRQQGQADARHLRPQSAAAAGVAARVVRQAEGKAGADSEREPRDELGGRGQGQDRRRRARSSTRRS